MTRLSVNINKVALIRNSRALGLPDIVKFAADCEAFGAQGITVHPRPDERHIRYRDVYDLKKSVTTELNVEGNPGEKFLEVVLDARPHQATLVPDDPNQLTSDHGWDTIKHQNFLQDVIGKLKEKGIRVSIFVDPVVEMVEAAVQTGTNCIELYTEPYASQYAGGRQAAIAPYIAAAQRAADLGLMVHAGHDLNLQNLQYFAQNMPQLHEVSIGHALVTDALYYGISNTISMYKRLLA
ncbi:pyridoxine 5'-phosphate synthase [bacterium]|nr:pyridoxine 5'-phosphate synthase [bacterium]